MNNLKKIIKRILPTQTVLWLKSINLKKLNKRMLSKCETILKFDKTKYPFGINLMGDIKAETGLGQSMRILANILEKSNIPFCIYQINSPGKLAQNDSTWNHKIADNVKYAINLIHINPSIWAETYVDFKNDILDYRYNIAYWLWELEEFPNEWVSTIETVDEIWAPSEFICRSIRKKTNKKVIKMPYVIDIDQEHLYDRNYFKIPDHKFFFLLMYDFQSISERKNPEAAIQAFIKALSVNENAGIIIKVNHLENTGELTKLKSRLKDCKYVYFITNNMSRPEIESLIYDADVLVSLHRSEGFGLPMAEAMYLGTPVVATNWSANTEFMTKESSCLVDCRLIEIEKDIGPYKKGNKWANADIEQAAEYMLKLCSDTAFYREKVIKGKEIIKDKLGYERIVELVNAGIEEIWGTK